MDNKGLIFIPDISGFTKFINQTEIEHSKHIIEELLETIINANKIDLKISEIEGDAILFYKFGECPTISQLQNQVEAMFVAFHKQLLRYESDRICQCGACSTAVNLSLKFITHKGEFTIYQVKDFYKLLGKDVILAHQLLKNDIPEHEYWLVTNSLLFTENQLPENLKWQKGGKKTEDADLEFRYAYLTGLREDLKPDPLPDLLIEGKKVKIYEMEMDFEQTIDSVFDTITDLSLKPKWLLDVIKTDEVSHKINRVGASHRCVFKKDSSVQISSSFSRTADKIIYTETDKKKTTETCFTIQAINESLTKLKVDFYLRKNLFILMMYRLFMKNKFENQITQSGLRLRELFEQKK